MCCKERWYGLGCGALPFALEMISPEEDRCDAEECGHGAIVTN